MFNLHFQGSVVLWILPQGLTKVYHRMGDCYLGREEIHPSVISQLLPTGTSNPRRRVRQLVDVVEALIPVFVEGAGTLPVKYQINGNPPAFFQKLGNIVNKNMFFQKHLEMVDVP